MNQEEKAKEIFGKVAQRLSALRRIPVSTYRVQLNGQFNFSYARQIVPYLHELGITDCYASPYFVAKKGSLHGYDILDPHHLNPEIGTEEEYDEFVKELKKYGMGQMLDIVPNHMCIVGNENGWWRDVLENGPSSVYADFFDIDWKPVDERLGNKILLPILGDQYGRVLENRELKLIFERGGFFIQYADLEFPVTPHSYVQILKFQIEDLEKKKQKDHPHFQEFQSILTALSNLPPITETTPEKISEKQREKEIIKKRLWNLCQESPEVASFISENVQILNGRKGEPRSFDLLDRLLNSQVYRLSFWRVASEEINYRRFFDINELAAIKVENPEVFEKTHTLVFRLIKEKKVTGLRVDHPDGLYNPVEYFHRLQKGCFVQMCLQEALPEDSGLEEEIRDQYDEALSRDPSSALRMPLYVVGEKILTKGERMPEDWPIFSTTGYVFLNSVNGLFVDMKNDKIFDDIYRRFTRSEINFQDIAYEKKKLIMEVAMASEINTLGHYLDRLSEKNRYTRDFTLNSLTTAIIEVIANFPVYRTYVTQAGANERDRRYIEQAVSRAKRKNPAISATLFDFLEKVLLLQYPEDFTETDRVEWLDFVMRFQQLTGPVMARGVEDTAFYIYHRFISLNEVGANPERFGTSLDTFHGQNIERTKYWPYAMITTSTHDTKRSEDVRARLNVLSEIPDEWRQAVFRWSRMNKRNKSSIDGQWVPDRNDEYLFYQTLVGVWPVLPMSEEDDPIFRRRIQDYMVKAVREAKVHTSWVSPNTSYENGLLKFIDAVLSFHPKDSFMRDFLRFQERVAYFGMLNSLSQTLLKITSPGVPDFYQGTEIWNFTLVDPDNRKPVDFSARKKMLGILKEKMVAGGSDLRVFCGELLRNWEDGMIKLYVTFKALNDRKKNSQLFKEGDYVPLMAHGEVNEYVCAFARRNEDQVHLVIVPRFLTRLIEEVDEGPIGEKPWGNSILILPDDITGNEFNNIFTGEIVRKIKQDGQGVLALREIFANFPVAMLERANIK